MAGAATTGAQAGAGGLEGWRAAAPGLCGLATRPRRAALVRARQGAPRQTRAVPRAAHHGRQRGGGRGRTGLRLAAMLLRKRPPPTGGVLY